MKTAERIIMSVLGIIMIAGIFWVYLAVKHEQASLRDAVARGEYEQPVASSTTAIAPEDWRILYPNTVPLMIGGTTVRASVADTHSARMKGLSGTPFLPEDVVKLFAFGANGIHSIWMKDMHYSIDIMWVSREGEIVHIEEQVAPETYPETSFSSPVLAWYVIEANAGFVNRHGIRLGDRVVLPQ